jgi:hypothetical protein
MPEVEVEELTYLAQEAQEVLEEVELVAQGETQHLLEVLDQLI